MSERPSGAPSGGPPHHRFENETATYELWLPAPDVVLQRVTGKADIAIARAIVRELELVLARSGALAIFDDFAEMTGYTSEGRVALTEWSKQNWSRLRSTHVLVGSKLVAMGVTVASIALPGLRSYDDRARFEAALNAEVAHARRRIPA